jgi:glycosyltransferase involved in cell wall biosynthesis
MQLSVIVPVHNGGEDLQKCLDALAISRRVPDELIVVDDASTDDAARQAHGRGVRVLFQSGLPLGPAKSRNRGAEIASGDILVFVDADVMVHQDTLTLIEDHFSEHPDLAALFGSYDDNPPHRGLVSQYKNLLHHFVHHHSRREASTFWSGLGAIRRNVFIKLGGFNEGYSRPSIEDIELGGRLKHAGYRIWLCREIQGSHLKCWNILSMLRSDIFDRAVPWTRLILSTSQLPSDLNLDFRSRLSALAAWGAVSLLFFSFWFPFLWVGVVLMAGLLVVLNFPLYQCFYRRNGLGFAAGAFFLHFLYFLYSSFVFGTVWGGHFFLPALRVSGVSADRVDKMTE